MLKFKFIIFIFIFGLFLPFSYVEAGTVLSSHKYAWSDNVGYINFEDVTVEDDILSGYAWSENKGWINFNPTQGGVTNDGSGNLAGSAWGEQLGWIDFDNVSIDPSTGKFSGTATGELVGTITFDCPNFCDVETDWRQNTTSSIASLGTSQGSSASGRTNALGPVIPFIPSVVVLNELENTTSSTGAFSEIEVTDDSDQIFIENPPLFDVISEPVQVRVAPGEILPISVRLSNFGGGKRVDVLIEYSIFSSTGKEIYSISETVAVETTANFIKSIQIPLGTVSGTYTAKTSIIYGGQLAPAITQFPFKVERKILGLFQSDFFLYGGITLIISFFALLLGRVLIKRRKSRFAPFDYSNIPHNERTFYEILSDTIMQMRQRVGDDALFIASNISGLQIDKKNGRVLAITESPAKVIAVLVSKYEKILGKKVSFSLRRE
ncbi:MAG TPA: hypothetical protein VJH67_01605 [Candidatus Paceibacterota bacterium]